MKRCKIKNKFEKNVSKINSFHPLEAVPRSSSQKKGKRKKKKIYLLDSPDKVTIGSDHLRVTVSLVTSREPRVGAGTSGATSMEIVSLAETGGKGPVDPTVDPADDWQQ